LTTVRAPLACCRNEVTPVRTPLACRRRRSNAYQHARRVRTAMTPNQQGLDICSTPRAEMDLYPLDTFPYEFPGKEIKINFEIPEFTCVCPFSDFPDFATIRLEYVPNERCIELKSLKLYINSFRNVKVFHEHVINMILEDFVNACDPLSVELEGDFNVRGNIKTTVRASYKKQ
jgi:7-cyano-7-deazaguanine reductase